MFFRPANQVLFIDVANAAASSDARSELARQVPHRYCSELEDGLKLLRKNTANLVVLSGQDITEELSHQCSLIAGTRPQESLPVVLLLAEESGTHPELQLAGVVGVTTIQGTWQSTARQLAQIAELLTKIRRLKQDLRLSNLATKAFDIACCSIRSETGECTTDPAFPRLLGFHDNTTTSTGFHWSRLLEHLTEADRQRFEANVNQALTNGKEWFLELTPRARNYRQ